MVFKMKKTLLAMTVLSTLFLAGTANAALVESTDGSFTGKLDFNGTITDTNPVWMWEITDASKAAATGWNSLVINGVVSGSNTTWTFGNKPSIELIRGYMKTPSISGGTGITPVIKVGPTESATTLDGTVQTITLVATGNTAASDAVAPGTMKLNVQGLLGGAHTTGQKFGAVEAQAIAELQDGYATTYPTAVGGTGSFSAAETALSNQDLTNITGAYLANLSNYELSFPSESVPATWTTTVPVTVTLK